jgi:hypothetical protein
MAAAAGLHGDLGGGKPLEESDHLGATEIGAKDRPLCLINRPVAKVGFGDFGPLN